MISCLDTRDFDYKEFPKRVLENVEQSGIEKLCGNLWMDSIESKYIFRNWLDFQGDPETFDIIYDFADGTFDYFLKNIGINNEVFETSKNKVLEHFLSGEDMPLVFAEDEILPAGFPKTTSELIQSFKRMKGDFL